MELFPKRGFELIPKRGDDEPAAEINVPFELDLDDGDRISATIAKSGTVEIRAVEPDKMFVLGTVIIEGFTPKGAGYRQGLLGPGLGWCKRPCVPYLTRSLLTAAHI